MSHHRVALLVILGALSLDAFLGVMFAAAQGIAVWHGLYNALANAVTLGGDVAPSSPAGYMVNALECLTVVPLFAATFSLFTSGLTAGHVQRSEARVRSHIQRIAAEPKPDAVRDELSGLRGDISGLAEAIRLDSSRERVERKPPSPATRKLQRPGGAGNKGAAQ